jgi:hypothetical protein
MVSAIGRQAFANWRIVFWVLQEKIERLRRMGYFLLGLANFFLLGIVDCESESAICLPWPPV